MFMNSEPENNFILALYTLRIKKRRAAFSCFSNTFENARKLPTNETQLSFSFPHEKRKSRRDGSGKKAFLKTQ
jgi:hypothetical protein